MFYSFLPQSPAGCGICVKHLSGTGKTFLFIFLISISTPLKISFFGLHFFMAEERKSFTAEKSLTHKLWKKKMWSWKKFFFFATVFCSITVIEDEKRRQKRFKVIGDYELWCFGRQKMEWKNWKGKALNQVKWLF